MKARYDVALSFAGEDRPLAERVAGKLKEANLRVFYDDDAKADLWGANLVERLTSIYSKHSRYVVLFISKASAAKAWPRQERRAALERALIEEGEYILPVRLDDVEIEGLLQATSYIDLRRSSEEELVRLIIEKVGKGPASAAGGDPAARSTRLDVLEQALELASSPIGLDMEVGEAREWAEGFADRFFLDDLKRYRTAFGLGRDELGWPIEDSMFFGRAVLEWTADQFDGFTKSFEFLLSFNGPGLDPEEALDLATEFCAEHESRRFNELKRAVQLAESTLDIEGREAVEFALDQLRRG